MQAAARELSVREGVGAAMSLAPEQDPDVLRATWSRTQHPGSRNSGRNSGRTTVHPVHASESVDGFLYLCGRDLAPAFRIM